MTVWLQLKPMSPQPCPSTVEPVMEGGGEPLFPHDATATDTAIAAIPCTQTTSEPYHSTMQGDDNVVVDNWEKRRSINRHQSTALPTRSYKSRTLRYRSSGPSAQWSHSSARSRRPR